MSLHIQSLYIFQMIFMFFFLIWTSFDGTTRDQLWGLLKEPCGLQNISGQSIWASWGRAGRVVLRGRFAWEWSIRFGIVVFPCIRLKFRDLGMSPWRASCSPDVSRQSISTSWEGAPGASTSCIGIASPKKIF